jgi:hypothetical protein
MAASSISGHDEHVCLGVQTPYAQPEPPSRYPRYRHWAMHSPVARHGPALQLTPCSEAGPCFESVKRN